MKMFFSLMVPILILVGCAAPRPQLPPAPEPQALLQRLALTGQRWQQLDAAAKVGIQREGKYFSTQQFMLLEKPDRLRVDVLSLFSQLALQLTVDQGELQVFLNTTVPGQFYRGPASDELLARFTRLPLAASELVRLLLYDPPQSEYQTIRVEMGEDRYLLRLTLGDREQQFLFDDQLQLRRCLYLRSAEPLLIVDYAKIDEADAFPRRIQIEMPVQQTRVTLNLTEVRLNQPAKAGRFKLSPPANAIPLTLPGFDPAEERS
jgi:outer membrane biogenesis lipoprotein LolB